MASGTPGLATSSATDNFLLLARLLVQGSKELLKEKFDSIRSPANLPAVLQANKGLLTNPLSKKGLLKKETDILYPSPGKYGTSNDFDITLISRLLREICGLTPPSTGWHDRPSATDLIVEADLVRIKCYRNEIYHHSSLGIDDCSFLIQWKEASDTLLRIAASISVARELHWKQVIKNLEKQPLTLLSKSHVQELELWYQYDRDVRKSLHDLQTICDDNTKGIDRIEKDTKDSAQALGRVEKGLDKVPSDGGIISGTLHDLQTSIEKDAKDSAQALGRVEECLDKVQSDGGIISGTLHDLQTSFQKDAKDSAQALGRVEKVGGDISRKSSSIDPSVCELRDAIGELQSTKREQDATINLNIHVDVASSNPPLTCQSSVSSEGSTTPLHVHRSSTPSQLPPSQSPAGNQVQCCAGLSGINRPEHCESSPVLQPLQNRHSTQAMCQHGMIHSHEEVAMTQPAPQSQFSSYQEFMTRVGMQFVGEFSNSHDFKMFLQDIGLIVTGQKIGSLVITVHCKTVQVLERLWTV